MPMAGFLRELLFIRDGQFFQKMSVLNSKKSKHLSFIDELCNNYISNFQSCVIIIIVCTFVCASCMIS